MVVVVVLGATVVVVPNCQMRESGAAGPGVCAGHLDASDLHEGEEGDGAVQCPREYHDVILWSRSLCGRTFVVSCRNGCRLS